MRVTNRMLVQTVLRNIQSNVKALEKVQDKVSSGKRITRPADDPAGAPLAVRLRLTRDTNEQYLRNIDQAKGWLESTDASFVILNDILQRARELAIQGANDTLTATDRQAIRQEVEQLIQHTVQLANSTYQDQFLFGGYKTVVAAPPYARDGAGTVTYSGDFNLVERQIGPMAASGGSSQVSRIVVNIPGKRSATTGPFGDTATSSTVFWALKNLSDGLNTNNATTIRTAISNVDSAVTGVLDAQAEVGAKLNRLERARARIDEVQLLTSDLLSRTEDLDFAEAISELATREQVYRASLDAGARSIQPSLLDFLR